MSTSTKAEKSLRDAGVILSGHFKLRSGNHSDIYINKDLIWLNPERIHYKHKKVESITESVYYLEFGNCWH